MTPPRMSATRSHHSMKLRRAVALEQVGELIGDALGPPAAEGLIGERDRQLLAARVRHHAGEPARLRALVRRLPGPRLAQQGLGQLDGAREGSSIFSASVTPSPRSQSTRNAPRQARVSCGAGRSSSRRRRPRRARGGSCCRGAGPRRPWRRPRASSATPMDCRTIIPCPRRRGPRRPPRSSGRCDRCSVSALVDLLDARARRAARRARPRRRARRAARRCGRRTRMARWTWCRLAMTATPGARRPRGAISSTVADDSGSRLATGSSARITLASWASARAMATRCCWPPES